jgi:hypothetical protein
VFQGAQPGARAFPGEVSAAIEAFTATHPATAPMSSRGRPVPGSRRMGLPGAQ